MATLTAYFTPDYDGALATATFVGTLATAAATGPLVVGKHRLIQIFFNRQTTPSNVNERYSIRFTLGNSIIGHAAITPTSTSPFFTTDEPIIFDMGEAYDSINMANLASDNTAITLGYTILPLSKF